MNPAKRALLFFKEYALTSGYKYKVAGDNAYSSRPMGMGKYLKLVSAKGNRLTIYESPSKTIGYRFDLDIPDDFNPDDK